MSAASSARRVWICSSVSRTVARSSPMSVWSTRTPPCGGAWRVRLQANRGRADRAGHARPFNSTPAGSGAGGLSQQGETDLTTRARHGDAARHVQRSLTVPRREEGIERLDVRRADVAEGRPRLGREEAPDAGADRAGQRREGIEVDAGLAGRLRQPGPGPDRERLEVVGILP